MIQAVVESGAEKSELLGGFAHRTVAFTDCLDEELAFLFQLHLPKAFVGGNGFACCLWSGAFVDGRRCSKRIDVQVFGLQNACAGKAKRALNYIFEFANVARPVVFLQLVERFA